MQTGPIHQIATYSISALIFVCAWIAHSASAAVVILPYGVDVASSYLRAAHLTTRGSLSVVLDKKTDLPAQIVAIVGSYAFCLVIVFFTLLLLSKRRREHLRSGKDLDPSQPPASAVLQFPETLHLQDSIVPFALKGPTSDDFAINSVLYSRYPIGRNTYDSVVAYGSIYSAGSPISPVETNDGTVASALHGQEIWHLSSLYALPFRAPGVDPSVDQKVVSADREMAQSQLEAMYKYVMEHEEAKANGVVLTGLPAPLSLLTDDSRSSNPYNRHQKPTDAATAGAYIRGSTSSLSRAATRSTNEPATLITATRSRTEKTKPAGLKMSLGHGRNGEEEQMSRTSRTSSLFSALKSPRLKKKIQGVSISSPIMTPTSDTFPRFGPAGGRAGFGYGNDTGSSDGFGDGCGDVEAKDVGAIPLQHYAPRAPSPPLPPQQTTTSPLPLDTLNTKQRVNDESPADHLPPQHTFADRTQTGSSRRDSERATLAQSEASKASDELSPAFVELHAPPNPSISRVASLVSLPASPRATKTAFFQPPPPPSPSLQQNWPLSPTGIAFASAPPSSSFASSSFSRPKAPSAIRIGGGLPLRAYEPSITSPSFATKQTVFERTAPSTSGGASTPWTGAPVPYSPYQPFSPVVPMTPSLVTKADRKRMRRLEPKTPTLVMVPSADDLW